MREEQRTKYLEQRKPERPPLSVKIIFAIGQLGWSLASFGALNLLIYFYMPPEDGKTDFPDYIFQGNILLGVTIIGLIAFGGRIFDAFTDPFIANLSDKSTSKFGKRKRLMAIGALPFALFSVLVFYPIGGADMMLNTAWLVLMSALFFFFFTVYVVPYNALIGELGHHPKDRMLISTLISVTFALGFVLGGMAYAMQKYFEGTGMASAQAFQISIVILAVIALLCMLIPVFFLDENRYCKQTNSAIGFAESGRIVWQNKNFRYFVFSDLTYWLSVTIIQTGVIYYTTILLGLGKDKASLFGLGAFALSFLLYIPINFAVAHFGKKKLINLGFLLFASTFILTFFLGKLPFSPMIQLTMVIVLAAFPLAIFGIIPTAIIADEVNRQSDENGDSQAAMYFGFRTFMMKLGVSLALLIFPSLLNFGKSVDNDWGVRLTAMAAFAFCLLGWFLFRNYKEVKT